MSLTVGNIAPDFTLSDGEGNEWSLSNRKGRVVVLLFYPRDNTPVCTKQLCSVRDHWSEYQATGAEIVGISSDSAESHKNFSQKYELPFRLLADAGGKVSSKYGSASWISGRAARSVVVIDKDGKVAYHKTQSLSLFRPADEDVLEAIRKAD